MTIDEAISQIRPVMVSVQMSGHIHDGHVEELRSILAALSVAPEVEQQPVGWRWRMDPTHEWRWWPFVEDPRLNASGRMVDPVSEAEPLYLAAPASVPQKRAANE
jgi:hypothetical protein